MPQESQNSNTSSEQTAPQAQQPVESVSTSGQAAASAENTTQPATETAAIAPPSIKIDSAEQAFNQALALQQQKKYDDALNLYKQILDQSPLSREQASTISHNISVIYFQKNNLPQAVVYNQKAIYLDYGNSAAHDFREQNKLPVQSRSVPHSISLIENLNSAGFQSVPLELFFALMVVFLGLTLQKLLQFMLVRRKQSIDNEAPEKFPIVSLVWIGLFVVSSFFFGIKYVDLRQPKAIVRAEKTSVQTAPGENQAVIFELESGMIVQILQQSKQNAEAGSPYVQIKYPGAFSGWVKKGDLELLNRLQWP